MQFATTREGLPGQVEDRFVRRSLGGRFWVFVAAWIACTGTLVATVVWPTWIELLFGIDPDHGSGFAEVLIVVASLTGTVTATMAAGREWARASARTPRTRRLTGMCHDS